MPAKTQRRMLGLLLLVYLIPSLIFSGYELLHLRQETLQQYGLAAQRSLNQLAHQLNVQLAGQRRLLKSLTQSYAAQNLSESELKSRLLNAIPGLITLSVLDDDLSSLAPTALQDMDSAVPRLIHNFEHDERWIRAELLAPSLFENLNLENLGFPYSRLYISSKGAPTEVLIMLREVDSTLDTWRGTKVQTASLDIDGLALALDTEESAILQQVYQRFSFDIYLLLGLGCVVAALVYQLFIRRLRSLVALADRSGGELGLKNNDDNDEVTHLTQAWSQVIANVESQRVDLAAEVKKRTLELESAYAELESTREENIHTARLATIGEVSSGVAHEINQPLTGIRMSAELMQMQVNEQDDPQLKEDLQGILQNVERIAGITSHLRGLSRRNAENFRDVNMQEVLSRAIVLMSIPLERAGITITTEIADEIPAVSGDPLQLEQILINLINNARDAVKNESDPQIQIRANQQSGFVTIEVDDNGCGVTEDNRNKIWETFFTTKPMGEGTGLGLGICQRIIRSHKGQLRMSDSRLNGACFHVELPLASTNLTPNPDAV